MNNFASIDQNRIATPKQQYAVAGHFASIQAQSPSERFGLTKVFYAILNKFYSESDSKMTHGDVQNYFEHDVVPAHFVSSIKKPKASKKSKPKASKKSTQTVEEAIENIDSKKASKSKAKPKAPAKNSVAAKMDDRITALETQVSEQGSKLDAILAILQK